MFKSEWWGGHDPHAPLVFPTDEYFDTNKKFKLYFCFSSPLTSLHFYARRAPIDLVSTQEFWLGKGLPQPRTVTNGPRGRAQLPLRVG